MNGRFYLATGVLALLSAGATLYWQQRDMLTATPMPVEQTDRQPVPSDVLPSGQRSEQQRLLAAPQVRQQEQRLLFHSAYRDFFTAAPALDAAERTRQAEALRADIERYEQRRELAMNEALLMQLGLIQVTVSDETEQKVQASALVARYQTRSAARQASVQPDARFQRYKEEEQRIVEDVMATDDIPDGLSRDQYLRQRLQQARERAYQ